MISPPRLSPPIPPSAERAPGKRQRACLRIRAPVARGPRQEKDPGSAFGPEPVPSATGLVSVVYWNPRALSRPSPRPAGPAGEPGAGPGQQLTPDPDHVKRPPRHYTTDR